MTILTAYLNKKYSKIKDIDAPNLLTIYTCLINSNSFDDQMSTLNNLLLKRLFLLIETLNNFKHTSDFDDNCPK